MGAVALTVQASINGSYQGANDLSTLTQAFAKIASIAFGSGTTAGKADLVFADTRTLAASANESLDLNGVLADAFGSTFSAVDVVAIMIAAAAGNTNDVLVGGAASNGFSTWVGDATDVVKVKPGGVFLLAAPGDPAYAVTAGTGDLLKIANSAGSTGVTYDIIVIGRSA